MLGLPLPELSSADGFPLLQWPAVSPVSELAMAAARLRLKCCGLVMPHSIGCTASAVPAAAQCSSPEHKLDGDPGPRWLAMLASLPVGLCPGVVRIATQVPRFGQLQSKLAPPASCLPPVLDCSSPLRRDAAQPCQRRAQPELLPLSTGDFPASAVARIPSASPPFDALVATPMELEQEAATARGVQVSTAGDGVSSHDSSGSGSSPLDGT